MGETHDTHPIEYLRAIEEGCHDSGVAGYGRSAETTSEWSGVAYRIKNNVLVSQLGEVIEILDMPQMSRVPLTQSWVRGVANIRGNLLPVVDLAGCLSGQATRISGKARVLVIDYNGFYSGLVVDEVMGLRHFLDEEYSLEETGVDGYLEPYTQNVFRRGDRKWAVFSLHALADSPRFLQAAA